MSDKFIYSIFLRGGFMRVPAKQPTHRTLLLYKKNNFEGAGFSPNYIEVCEYL
jgi:hypothetical protein